MFPSIWLAVFIHCIALNSGQNINCNADWSAELNFNKRAQRIYYIGCVQEEWSYDGGSGMDKVTGEPITETSAAGKWLFGDSYTRIGPSYMKMVYREFTNNCFTEQSVVSKFDEHLGAIGPVIRAITGENIKVFYKNMCVMPNSIHVHGLFYPKDSEGAPYVDDDGITAGDSVPENGGQYIYFWKARPNMVDPGTSSKLWIYHSHVNAIRDIHTGLAGPIVITEAGMENSYTDLCPKDVSREFVTFFVLFDENLSWLFQDNMDNYLTNPPPGLIDDPSFRESNLMHSINGYLFGNLDTLTCTGTDDLRWYTASLGNELDGPHSPHWHGNIGVTSYGENTDTVVLIAGTTATVTMKPDAAGIWLYHCHVFDHIAAGMHTTYTVENVSPVPTPTIPPPQGEYHHIYAIDVSGAEYCLNAGINGAITSEECEFNTPPASQLWYYDPITKQISNEDSTGCKCLDVDDADYISRRNGGQLFVYGCIGWMNQKWEYDAVNGHFINSNGLCLDIQAHHVYDGATVWLWTCDNRPQQSWMYGGFD